LSDDLGWLLHPARVKDERAMRARARLRKAISRATSVDAHVKDEAYPLPKPCRLINARADWSKNQFGPIFSAIEKVVCKLPWFIKYTPVADRPRAIIDRLYVEGGHYVCTDYTSFEAHFTPDIMWAIERPLYRYMTGRLCSGDSDRFMGLWDMLICSKNNIKVGNLFKAFVEGVRMSGEMNTSLGNGWSNLVLFMFALHQNGATWDDMFDNVPGFVEGDDGLFRIPENVKAPTSAQMESYGFSLKIDNVTDISEASFCGMVFDHEEQIIVNDPIEVLMKLSWLPRKYMNCSDTTALELLKAKAQSALHLYNGCPIVTVACARILELTKHVKITKKSYDFFDSYHIDTFVASRGVVAQPIGKRTRELVERQYGITAEMQMKIEKQLANQELGSYSLDLPQRYDHYAWCYDTYVNFPVQPCPTRRKHYYQFLEKVYLKAGTKLPPYGG